MAQVEPTEEDRAVDLPPGRHEAREETFDRGPNGRVILREPERDEQQQRPRRRGPTALRPLAVGALMGEQLRRPARLDYPPARSRFPGVGRLAEQVAHHLPAHGRVAVEEPLDHGLVARHPGRGR